MNSRGWYLHLSVFLDANNFMTAGHGLIMKDNHYITPYCLLLYLSHIIKWRQDCNECISFWSLYYIISVKRYMEITVGYYKKRIYKKMLTPNYVFVGATDKFTCSDTVSVLYLIHLSCLSFMLTIAQLFHSFINHLIL